MDRGSKSFKLQFHQYFWIQYDHLNVVIRGKCMSNLSNQKSDANHSQIPHCHMIRVEGIEMLSDFRIHSSNRYQCFSHFAPKCNSENSSDSNFITNYDRVRPYDFTWLQKSDIQYSLRKTGRQFSQTRQCHVVYLIPSKILLHRAPLIDSDYMTIV